MIPECQHISLISLKMSFMESLVFGERIFTISHTMRFDICLGGDIQSILVAQVIPSRVVGIVASAHGIRDGRSEVTGVQTCALPIS